MRFVETPLFTKVVYDLFEDEEYRRLQLALLLRPEQGAIISGGAGLRKVRWGARGRGKRGRDPRHLLSRLVREEFK